MPGHGRLQRPVEAVIFWNSPRAELVGFAAAGFHPDSRRMISARAVHSAPAPHPRCAAICCTTARASPPPRFAPTAPMRAAIGAGMCQRWVKYGLVAPHARPPTCTPRPDADSTLMAPIEPAM